MTHSFLERNSKGRYQDTHQTSFFFTKIFRAYKNANQIKPTKKIKVSEQRQQFFAHRSLDNWFWFDLTFYTREIFS